MKTLQTFILLRIFHLGTKLCQIPGKEILGLINTTWWKMEISLNNNSTITFSYYFSVI